MSSCRNIKVQKLKASNHTNTSTICTINNSLDQHSSQTKALFTCFTTFKNMSSNSCSCSHAIVFLRLGESYVHGHFVGGHVLFGHVSDTDTLWTCVRHSNSKCPIFFQHFPFEHSGDTLKNAPDTLAHLENKSEVINKIVGSN